MKNESNRMARSAAPAGLLLLAFLLRAVYVLSLPDQLIWSDEKDHFRLSQSLALGQGYVSESGEPTAIRPPGFPLFLAVLRKVGVESLLAFRLMQAFLGTLTLWLLYRLVRSICSERSWALTTLALGALYPYFIYLPGALLATTWFSLLLVASVYFIHRSFYYAEPWPMVGAGLTMGLATLAVPTGLILIAASLLWLLRYHVPLKHIVLYAALVLLTLCPWLLRNGTQVGVWNLSSTGGYNFWLGNNPQSQIELPGQVRPPLNGDGGAIDSLPEKERDQFYTAEAWRYIFQQPGRFLLQTGRKALYFWRLDPSPVTQSHLGLNRSIQWLGTISFTLLFLSGVVGFALFPNTLQPLRTLWFYYFFAFTLLYAVTIVKVRFRLPLDHLLLILSAYGLVQLAERFFSPWRRTRPLSRLHLPRGEQTGGGKSSLSLRESNFS